MEMEYPAIYNLPEDTLHHIFSLLPLPFLIQCRTVSKFFYQTLSSLSFSTSLSLLSLRPTHHRSLSINTHSLHAFSPDFDHWLTFDLSFLPFVSPLPVASSHGLVFLWAQVPPATSQATLDPSVDLSANPEAQFQALLPAQPNKVLIACNPVSRTYRVLPQLGSAWSRHGSVLVGPPDRVIVLTELAALYFNKNSDSWVNFSSNLPSKPRSPILIGDAVLSLCDVGSPWRNQWKLFSCRLSQLKPDGQLPFSSAHAWSRVEKHEWGDVFDILKRPRLVRGVGNRVLMIGGLRSSFSLNSACSTILILRLDLETLEWDEAGRMPVEMFGCFQESSKFKVFGGGERVAFSAKRVGGRLALWENGDWRWIEGGPGGGDGLSRGFLFEARLDAVP